MVYPGHKLEAVLKNYCIKKPCIMKRLKGGYANKNYKLTSNKENYLFRIFLEKDRGEILHEIKILKKLRKKNFPCALPIARRNGEYISLTEEGFVVIYEFIHGHEPAINRHTVAEIGRYLGQLNSFEGRGSLKRDNSLNIAYCRTLMSRLDRAKNMERDIFEYFIRETRELAPALGADIPVGLIHGDIFPDNTIYNGNKLAAIVDFEEACTDRLLIDVGVAVNGFCFPNNRLDRELLKIFLREYQRIRPLSTTEKELLPHYIRWGTHAMLAWHLGRLVDSFERRKMERVRVLVKRGTRLGKGREDNILPAMVP